MTDDDVIENMAAELYKLNDINRQKTKTNQLTLNCFSVSCEGIRSRFELSRWIENRISETALYYCKKAEELGRKEQELQSKEQQLNIAAADLNRKSKELISDRQSIDKQVYTLHLSALRSAHCKKEYTKSMGQTFGEEHCSKAIAAGRKIGKDEHQVKQEISYAMVDIYQTLEVYDKAYDYLVEQVAPLHRTKHCFESWILWSFENSVISTACTKWFVRQTKRRFYKD